MCGIAGIFHRNGAPVDLGVLVRMTRTLVHRGPDEEGYFVNGQVPVDALGREDVGTAGAALSQVVELPEVVGFPRRRLPGRLR